MNITCFQEQFKKALSHVNRAIAAKSPLPILTNVLLTAEGDTLTLAASDLDITISQEIQAHVVMPGSITLPSRLLTDLINNLPNDQVALSLDEETQAVRVSCGQFVTNIKGIPSEDFPSIPAPTATDPSVSIKSSTLRYVIERVAFAASTDESRPALTGVLVQMKNDDNGNATAVFSAADGFRLATRSVVLENTTITEGSILEEFIVPARALVELARILADNDFDASIVALSNGQILVRAGGTQLVTRLIDGKFPDFSRIIPTQYTMRTIIETTELLKAAKLAALFASASNNFIKITMIPNSDDTPGKFIISANAPEMGDNTSEIDCTIEADDDIEQSVIALNVRFLMDVLTVVDSPRIAIETQTSKNPAVFMPTGGYKNYTCLIMPMTLRD